MTTTADDKRARDTRLLAERLQAIADEAARLGNPARRRKLTKQDIDELWDNP